MAAATGAALLYFLANRWNYNALDSGEETAKGLGVEVEKIQLTGMRSGKKMNLTVDGLSFSYRSRAVLKRIRFTVEKGELFAVLGNNGAGKSTLLKCLNLVVEKHVISK